ncbi:MAG: type II toxin-antitoxin system PemK/MazF family toxin [Oscillospiraceae bacterium]|nr:type II toxin-antitoxin system PemK/MazF family toxin [Oscillospiraceae bacterium]
MDAYEIYVAYISWASGGKRRPVLVIEENAGNVTVFDITTQYQNKSESIRVKYFQINDWRQAGLDMQSYIDTNSTITVSLTAIDSKNPIGRLSAGDEERLIEFING